MTDGGDSMPDVARVATVTADLARALESPRDPAVRLRHALRLACSLVASDRCALLHMTNDDAIGVISTVDDPAFEQRVRRLWVLMLGGDIVDAGAAPITGSTRIALPISGDDTLMGIIVAEKDPPREYQPHDVNLLAAVASQIGGYLAFVRLHHAMAERARLLTERERELEKMARFREEFIGVVSHDLRTPLGAIVASSYVLRASDSLGRADRDTVERIARSAERMSRLADDLLDFTRGRLGGGIALTRRQASVGQLCRRVIDELIASHRDRTVLLNITGDDVLAVDGNRIAQLLSNLVGNALHYSPNHSPVCVMVHGDASGLAIKIKNHGEPIPDGELASIFDPFKRGLRQAASGGAGAGAGLGLYIADQIARAHDGTIHASSSPTDGTVFTVWLPSMVARAEAPAFDTESVA